MLVACGAAVFFSVFSAYRLQISSCFLSSDFSEEELEKEKAAEIKKDIEADNRAAWHAVFKVNFIYFSVWGGAAYFFRDWNLGAVVHSLLSCGLASVVVFGKGRTGLY